MSWAAIIPLIAQYGIPYAFQIWQIITQHPEPTQEAWDKLLAMSQKTYDQYIEEAKAAAAAQAAKASATPPATPAKPA